MPKARILLLFVLVAALVAPTRMLARAQTGQVALIVHAGYDGYAKENQWIPVRITLTNSGPDVNGAVKISAARSNGSALDFVRPVELPSGARKEVFMYVAAEGYVSKLDVSYAAGKQTYGSASVRLSQVSANDLLYGVVSSSPSAFNVLARVDPVNGQAHVAQLALDDLPPMSEAWKALDVLVVSDADTGPMTDGQKAALKAWVSGGGRLLAAGGPSWQKTVAGLADLLPVQPNGTETVNGLEALAAYANEAAPAGAAIAAVGTVRPGAQVLVTDGLLAGQPLGYGAVFFLAMDPALAPLKSWAGMEGVYRALLSVSGERPGWANLYRNWYNGGEAVSTIPGVSLPHVLQIIVFLGGYVLAIGPLNYFILRRLKRREWAWVTVPVLVVLFTGITYTAGFSLRGTRPTLHRLAVAQVWENSDRAEVEALIGIFSPNRDEYDLSIAGDMLLKPFPSDAYYGALDTSLDGSPVEQGDSVVVRRVRVDVGAVKPFWVQGQVAAPKFVSNLKYDVQGTQAALDGTITNLSDVTLLKAVILTAGGVQSAGDVAPGATVSVGVPLAATRSIWALQSAAQVRALKPGPPVSALFGYAPTSNDTTVDDILGGVSYYNDRETYRRYTLLTWLFDPYNSGGRGSGTYLVGWADTSPVQASLPGRKYNIADQTLYIVRLQPQVVVSLGRVTITPGLMSWQAIDTGTGGNATPYDTYLNPGYFVLRYKPVVEMDFKSVESVTAHLNSYGATGAAPFTLSLLDESEGAWVPVDNLNWGDVTVANAGRFVGPDGHIDVKLENTGFQSSVNIESLDFTLVVNR